MFIWSDESILWYQAAMEWTHYDVLLGEKLADFFQEEDEVYDIGCGIGYQSLALAKMVKHVTSVDVEPKVLHILNQKAKERGITNITPVKEDYKNLEEKCCDTVFICAFGALEKDFCHFIKLARKRLVVVKRNGINEKSGFVTKYQRFNGAGRDEEFLKKNNIPFRLKSFQADFGQPLRDYEEARRFAEHYGLKPEEASMEEYLRPYRLPEDNKTYRYYLPNMKEIHIFGIEKADAKRAVR